MRRVHPARKIVALATTYVMLGGIVALYVLPLDRERRVAHADLLAQSPAGSDASGLVLPLVELQQAHARRANLLRQQCDDLAATPSSDEILGKIGAALSAKSLDLGRFTPIGTRNDSTSAALAKGDRRLLTDRFEIEFWASLPELIDLCGEWTTNSLGFRIERLDITATAGPSRLQVLMSCALVRLEANTGQGATH